MTRTHARSVRRSVVPSALLAAVLLTGWPAAAQQPMLTGTATYRERADLPENAAFEATVRDVSRGDGSSALIGRTRVEPIQQVPISFAIPYDPNLVKPGNRYTIQARIVADGKLLFATVDPVPVFQDGQAAPVDLVLPRSSGIAMEQLPPPPGPPALLGRSDPPAAPIGPPILLGPASDVPSAQVPPAPAPSRAPGPSPTPSSPAPGAQAQAPQSQAPPGQFGSPPVDSSDVPYAPLAPLPATFTGTLPCADCDGILYTLAMSPDRAFTLQLEYLGRPGDPGFVYRGQWLLDRESRVLTLSGDTQRPLAFVIKDPNTLRMLDATGREIVSRQNYDLTRTRTLDRLAQPAPSQSRSQGAAPPTQQAPSGAMPGYLLRGFYRSAGGDSQFVECGGGRPVPVSPGPGEGAELQRAYERSQRQPGENVLVEVEGRIAIGPRPDGNSLGRVLVVDRFVGLRPGETCTPAEVRASAETPDVPTTAAPTTTVEPPEPKAPPPPAEPDAELRGTYWKLTRIGDQQVATPDGLEEPHLVLDPDRRDFAGHSGCNGLGGQFFIDKHYLTFSLGPSTLKACDDGMEQERAYRTELEKTEGWSVAGDRLTLYDADGTATLRFVAEDAG